MSESSAASRLIEHALQPMKATFVGKDEIIDLIAKGAKLS